MSKQVVHDLKNALADELERVSVDLRRAPESAAPHGHGVSGRRPGQPKDRARLIDALRVRLEGFDPAHFPRGRIGLGSAVQAREMLSGEVHSFVVVPFELADGSPEKVTPASPVGQAILGARQGDVVEIATPARTRVMRIEDVETIWDTIESWRGTERKRRTP